MKVAHFNVTIQGKVQGVRFRYLALEEAQQLNVFGYVRNMPDGTLYAELEAEKPALDQFIAWCNESPGNSTVQEIETKEDTIKGYKDFKIY